MQKSESTRRRNLLQIAAIGQTHTEALLANEGMRKIDGIRNRIDVRGIDGYEFVTLAQLNIAHDAEISTCLALFANARFLNHLYERTGAAIKNGQFQIVELNDGIVDADAGKRREQVFSGGDEHTLRHQAGGVTDAGQVASAGFDRETVEVGAVKHDSGAGGGGQNPEADGSTAMQTHSGARYRGTNCLLVWQREDV